MDKRIGPVTADLRADVMSVPQRSQACFEAFLKGDNFPCGQKAVLGEDKLPFVYYGQTVHVLHAYAGVGGLGCVLKVGHLGPDIRHGAASPEFIDS